MNDDQGRRLIDDYDGLAAQFEAKRTHLQAVAYRMLGSLSEAEDAVQDAWLHLTRSGTSGIENLGGWLTTVVARICLDMLRTRKVRREDSLDDHLPEHTVHADDAPTPEDEALLADSVGLALLVVLDTLTPAERLAFVLHDVFAVSFDEIAPIVGRTSSAARQLASRARRRVRGVPPADDADLRAQREVVAAFLAAARSGDFAGLLALLDPNVVLRADHAAVLAGMPAEIRGAVAVATQAATGGARAAQPALVNGRVGVIVAPHGRLRMILDVTMSQGKIVEITMITDAEGLRQADVAVLSD